MSPSQIDDVTSRAEFEQEIREQVAREIIHLSGQVAREITAPKLTMHGSSVVTDVMDGIAALVRLPLHRRSDGSQATIEEADAAQAANDFPAIAALIAPASPIIRNATDLEFWRERLSRERFSQALILDKNSQQRLMTEGDDGKLYLTCKMYLAGYEEGDAPWDLAETELHFYGPFTVIHIGPDRLEAFVDRTTKIIGARRVSDLSLTPADYGAARELPDRGWLLWRSATKGHVDDFHTAFNAMELCSVEDAELVEGQLVHQNPGCPGHNDPVTWERITSDTASTTDDCSIPDSRSRTGPLMPAADIARVCHAANRALQMLTDDPSPSPSWSEAPDWLQAAEIRGVEAARQGATPEDLHELWMEHRIADGWALGPIKNPDTRTHPCLVPYDDLPDGQRAKDAVFHAIVRALS